MEPTPFGGHAPVLYPVVLKVEGRQCLVVGGGPVAARKAAGLLACGAAVTLVAPAIGPDVLELERAVGSDMPGSLTLCRRAYRPGEAASFRLVVTATGVPEVDHRVAADADAAGIWVNAADDAAHCTFLLPSVYRDGRVNVAVSTGGASPSLATWIRRRVADGLGTDLGLLATVLEDARQRLKAAGRSTELVDWQAVLDGPLPSLVQSGQLDAARELLAGELPQRS